MAGSDHVNKKVMILYMIDRINGITWNQLINLCISTLYMDYFTFCELAEELQNDALIQVAQRKGETAVDSEGHPLQRCYLTPRGEKILTTLKSRLTLPVVRNINRLTSAFIDRTERQEIGASVTPDLNGGFQVSLFVREGEQKPIAIELTLANESTAEHIAANWQENASLLYPQILRHLSGGNPLAESESAVEINASVPTLTADAVDQATDHYDDPPDLAEDAKTDR
ncbi:MAG TPA: DUF4364 family protein [Clostridiaceae bacterium]|nr:DUF4364 family protein [Clostridiaceae bacterium]